MIGMLKRVFDLEKIDIECKQCKSIIDTTYVFCPKCQQPTDNYGKPIDYKKKFIQLLIIFGGLFIIGFSFYFMMSNLGLKMISFNNTSTNGLYHDSFNNSIELQSDGTVHYNQKNGNSISCHTNGTWSKFDNNQLSISLEINSNCSFVSRYSGTWEIKDCYKYEQEKAGCLVKGDEFYFFKK